MTVTEWPYLVEQCEFAASKGAGLVPRPLWTAFWSRGDIEKKLDSRVEAYDWVFSCRMTRRRSQRVGASAIGCWLSSTTGEWTEGKSLEARKATARVPSLPGQFLLSLQALFSFFTQLRVEQDLTNMSFGSIARILH